MRKVAIAAAVMLASPLAAKEDLGVFERWGAFRDASAARCYAIAKAVPNRTTRQLEPYATVATWPRQRIRGQVHFRLSRFLAENPRASLNIGSSRFDLVGGGGDVWAEDVSMDAAIIAAMRSSATMTVRATDSRGRRFSDRYSLDGVATALDAATLACSKS